MTQAELRNLLSDCLALWAVEAKVVPDGEGVRIDAPEGAFTVTAADTGLRPVRWFLQTPERVAADRPPRAVPSVVALLAALRNGLGGEGGSMLRVGGG